MLKKWMYAIRPRLQMRLWTLFALIVLNLIFGICGYTELYGTAGLITAITLSSLALCALFVVNILADYEIIRSLFAAPIGYHVFLTPTASWKILLGHVLSIVVQDTIGFALGIAGIVLQAFIFVNHIPQLTGNINIAEIIILLVTWVLYYFLFILTIFLAIVLWKSIFYQYKGRIVWGILTSIGIVYVLNWLYLLLMPFSELTRHGFLFHISLVPDFNLGMIAYIFLFLCKTAIVFYITAYLMERRMNL